MSILLNILRYFKQFECRNSPKMGYFIAYFELKDILLSLIIWLGNADAKFYFIVSIFTDFI